MKLIWLIVIGIFLAPTALYLDQKTWQRKAEENSPQK